MDLAQEHDSPSRFEKQQSQGYAVLRVSVGSGAKELLVEGLHEVARFLTAGETIGSEQSIILDIRVPETASTKAAAEAEAFTTACKGLLHSWVLENGAAVGPANLVVSFTSQDEARQLVIDYLSDEHGQFSRGSYIDVRSKR